MSDVNDMLAELQQADLKARHEAHGFFSDVAIIARDDGSVADAEAMALGFVTPTGAEGAQKIGACGIIEQPKYVKAAGGVKNAPLRMNWRILWLENRVINADTANGGTGKRALALARRSANLVDLYHSGGLTNLFTLTGIERVPGAAYYDETKEENTALVCWAVEFYGMEGDFVVVPKCERVNISPAGGATPLEVTLTTQTAGAAIKYSLDGSYPSLPYTEPFTVSSAGILRALARKTDFTDGDVSAAKFT